MGESTRRGLKAGLALALLAFMVYQIGPGRLMEAFARARPLYLILAFLVIVVDGVVRSFNWRLVLAAREDHVPLLSVFQAFAVGGFFGSFVPSSLGVEAGRAVALNQRAELSLARAASSLAMLSLAGFWALGVLFLTGLGGLTAVSDAPSSLATIALVALVAIVTVPALLWIRGTVPGAGSDNPIVERLARFAEALASYRQVRRRLLPVFGVALVNQLFAILVFYLVFRASGVRIHPLYFPVLVPAVTLARLIPASVAGFGAEQAAVVVIFGWTGVAASQAMAASLLASLLNGVFMAGCGLYFTGENLRALMRSSLDRPEEAPDPVRGSGGQG